MNFLYKFERLHKAYSILSVEVVVWNMPFWYWNVDVTPKGLAVIVAVGVEGFEFESFPLTASVISRRNIVNE